jgi:hypothetical protein
MSQPRLRGPRSEPISARSQRRWPFLVVLIGVAGGLIVALVGGESWRLGSLIIGAFLGVGAITRAALPRGGAGLLQVRGKAFDVVALGLASLAIIALAIAVPGG